MYAYMFDTHAMLSQRVTFTFEDSDACCNVVTFTFVTGRVSTATMDRLCFEQTATLFQIERAGAL
jgi:hypothetical protein